MNVMVVVSPLPVSVGTVASASSVARVGCRVIDTGITVKPGQAFPSLTN